MKLTVGPLPAAVYWRRRAVVLGGVLIVVLWLGYACTGSGSGANPASGDAKPSSSPVHYPSEEPSEDPPPEGGGDATGPSADPSASGSPGSGSGNGGAAPACTDSDLRIVPRPAHAQTPEGARLRIDLVITNVSSRSCKADIGADRQEVRLLHNAQRVWSSDDCNPQTGSHVEVLAPRQAVERFWVTWDGKTSAPKCEGDRKVVQSGSYTVVARLGNVTSKPVTVKVVEA
ncbi:MAG: hypothetical protein ACRDT4_14335 [Micromonosporaceae bacterium]